MELVKGNFTLRPFPMHRHDNALSGTDVYIMDALRLLYNPVYQNSWLEPDDIKPIMFDNELETIAASVIAVREYITAWQAQKQDTELLPLKAALLQFPRGVDLFHWAGPDQILRKARRISERLAGTIASGDDPLSVLPEPFEFPQFEASSQLTLTQSEFYASVSHLQQAGYLSMCEQVVVPDGLQELHPTEEPVSQLLASVCQNQGKTTGLLATPFCKLSVSEMVSAMTSLNPIFLQDTVRLRTAYRASQFILDHIDERRERLLVGIAGNMMPAIGNREEALNAYPLLCPPGFIFLTTSRTFIINCGDDINEASFHKATVLESHNELQTIFLEMSDGEYRSRRQKVLHKPFLRVRLQLHEGETMGRKGESMDRYNLYLPLPDAVSMKSLIDSLSRALDMQRKGVQLSIIRLGEG